MNRSSHTFLCVVVLAFAALVATPRAAAQSATALLVSDVHFDPFWDPGKVPQLAAAPVSQWQAILAAPPSPDQAASLKALEAKCPSRGSDTNDALLQSSLAAMKANAQSPLFLTLSGDLIAHEFSCKFPAVIPNATSQQYQAFVENTMAYVLSSLRAAYPSAPLYATLGNNDSGCDDYKLDRKDSFLSDSGTLLTTNLPVKKLKSSISDFASFGAFKTSLPAPFKHTHVLILDDLFQSRKYETCKGKQDDNGAKKQNKWLKGELKKARKHKEQIWVLGHIPPGIDPYATSHSKKHDVCAGDKPSLMLSSDDLFNTLSQYGDVVRLAIFAHTHMDEMRLIEPAAGSPQNAIPLKMVPSISPVDGNNPAFTIATISTADATLSDYTVIASSDQGGTTWAAEYGYQQAYQKTGYTPGEVTALINAFSADPNAQTDASKSYLRNYFVGTSSPDIAPYWSQYTCALANLTADSYHACRCPATK